VLDLLFLFILSASVIPFLTTVLCHYKLYSITTENIRLLLLLLNMHIIQNYTLKKMLLIFVPLVMALLQGTKNLFKKPTPQYGESIFTERSRKWPQVREQRRAATYDEDFFHSISSSSRGGHDQPSHSRGQQGGQRGGYNQISPARGNLSQTGRGAGYTPHYSFTPPPQYYAPRIYLGSRGGRGRGERGGRGGRGVRLPKKWY
jgi:hypothetical protein